MSRNNLELATWGDGTIRIAFWDSLEGKDQIFILNADGTVSRSEYLAEDDMDATITPVPNFSEALRELCAFIEGDRDAS